MLCTRIVLPMGSSLPKRLSTTVWPRTQTGAVASTSASVKDAPSLAFHRRIWRNTGVTPRNIVTQFSPPWGTSTLTLTITNPNTGTTALNGVAVTDSFPTGLQVAAVPGASNTCGGTFAPAAGDTTISLTGGTIAASSSCAVSVNVTPRPPGPK